MLGAMTTPTPQPRKISQYGWIPDLPDARDHMFSAPRLAIANPPPKADLRAGMPAVYDQGQIGSCTANAIAGAVEFDLLRQQLADFMPSRLFIYYNERAMEGSIGSDAGAMIRDGVKSVAKQGVCPETEWPYDATPADGDGLFPTGAPAAAKPSDSAYQDALQTRATSYQRLVQNLDQLKGCLATGYPFMFGFSVYESFESEDVAKTGDAPMPGPDEQLLGGHAVLAVGYDDETQRFLVRNSWGSGWGQEGYFTLPYTYLTTHGLATDFWTVRLVS
jgi:C1A family cysteine protease